MSLSAGRIAAACAERRKVAQVAFGLDRRLGSRAGFRRNEQMLSLKPRCLVAYPGNGVLERLVIQAKDKGVHVVDRRGPLGNSPKCVARTAVASGKAVLGRSLQVRRFRPNSVCRIVRNGAGLLSKYVRSIRV